ncbi:hypothetical protein L7F22_032207, partial [Adiantum nelumboides]|nr:hypothetical protein [Adiantum nelumboides]
MGVQEESQQAYKAQDTEAYEDYMQDKDVYEDCMDCQDFCEPNISQMFEVHNFQKKELQDDAICGSWITGKDFQISIEGPTGSTLAEDLQ